MSYAVKDGKDVVLFVDSEYVENQETVEKKEDKVEDKVEDKAEDKAEDKDQSAAYDPETGEINWDCPCLGGMAQGPCGEQFKAAFSCFVYSEAEPKGVDCVEKFKEMQDCFRQHPDVYGDEIDDDEEEEEETPKEKEVDATQPAEEEKSESITVSSTLEEGESSSFASWVSSWF
ncbi:Oxidoreductase [Apophysomyces ossiformis]|uniref:Mitochondrial intermembrane space import and assembly protein 40 n=1 Tax=Apophysomyces ossiformis TaxID=679940 RepID=A0A8H7ES06_9FUNG|nr:Oxidoreductase [Apophysomyces ossiformis]